MTNERSASKTNNSAKKSQYQKINMADDVNTFDEDPIFDDIDDEVFQA